MNTCSVLFYRSYVNRQHFRLRSFASLCSAVQYFWGRRSFQIRYAAHFLNGLAMILLRDSLSVRSFLIAAMTRYSGFFLLSLVTRFACDIGQLAKNLDLSFIWGHHHLHLVNICLSVDQLNTSFSSLHRADETQQDPNSCPLLQFLAFSLYLSYLRSISLASLFTSLSIFGRSDLLQILRKQVAFSFAVLCIIISPNWVYWIILAMY